jgi:hypothetical protein
MLGSAVRSWPARVLGEVGNPKAGAALLAVAGETKEDTSVRCNAIGTLGRI